MCIYGKEMLVHLFGLVESLGLSYQMVEYL